MRRLGWARLLLCLPALCPSAFASLERYPSYKPVAGISGELSSVGSDTLNNLVTLWADAFRSYYPGVNIQVEGKGSNTAPPSLIAGTAELGLMSRRMKSEEIEDFEAKFGYEPAVYGVALDALVVYVHRDNPLQRLSLESLDGIFSSTRRSGARAIDRWHQLGLDGPYAGRPISVYGRNSASGTYALFKDRALAGGDFRVTVREQPGSSAVVQSVATDPFGIGYSGIGYRTSQVKYLALSRDGYDYFEPTFETCVSGDYPLARLLYIYVNRPKRQAFDPLMREFFRFILSREGQAIVSRDGYFPLPPGYAGSLRAGLER